MSDGSTGGVCNDTYVAGAGVPGGHGGDNGGGEAGGVAVPHLCTYSTTCSRCVRWDVEPVQQHESSLTHVLGCMSDGKGVWGWLCMHTRGTDICAGYASVWVEGQILVEDQRLAEGGHQQFFTQQLRWVPRWAFSLGSKPQKYRYQPQG